MTPLEICREAEKRGLHLKPAGDMLEVRPKGACPPDFAELLKAHKPALLEWLSRPTAIAPRPQGKRGGTSEQWITVAKQVCAGEFIGADSTTIESLTIGLRSIIHPSVRLALRRLADEPQCPAMLHKAIISLITP